MPHEHQHLGPEGNCICVKCNITVPKQRGVPCRQMRCPQCGRPMLREGGYHHLKYLENLEKKMQKQKDMNTEKNSIQKDQSQEIEKKPEASVQVLTYKIAFPTNDGEFINPHFGRSRSFVVYEIQGKEVIKTEERFNDSHQGMPEHHHEHDHNHEHEHHNDPEHDEQRKTAHTRLLEILHDVDILIVNNLGPRIHQELIDNGYTVIKTSISKISDALEAYLKGVLKP